MLAVIIIAVVFTGLAVAIAWGASHGGFKGLGKVMATESRGGKMALNSALLFAYLGFGIAVPLIFIIGNRDNSNAQWAGVKLTASQQSGRELFADHCAVCHTLYADNAIGKTGPNLDTLKPPAALVLSTIKHGCTQSSTSCLGYGAMPAQLVQGQDARDVANFVAAVAGRR